MVITIVRTLSVCNNCSTTLNNFKGLTVRQVSGVPNKFSQAGLSLYKNELVKHALVVKYSFKPRVA